MSKRFAFTESNVTPLVAKDGTYEVTLLTPGQGATAYYTEELIARDAPTAFPKGTKVYLDHLAEGETRTAQKIIGKLIEDTTIRESDGAAINRLKPYKHWAEFVEEVREDVGLSISADGTATEGFIEGRAVRLAESLNYSRLNSVDIVPEPGREGSGFNESLDSGDADDQPESSAPGENTEGTKMELSDEAVTAIASAISDKVGAALTEALAPKPAEKDENADRLETVEAVQAIETAEVPASVKARLAEGLKDGSLGLEAIKQELATAVALREEIAKDVQAKFSESAGSGAVGALGATGSTSAAPTVKGWAV